MLASKFFEVAPLILTLGPAIISTFYGVGKKWQDLTIALLGLLFLFFTYIFFSQEFSSNLAVHSFIDLRYNKISIFVGALY